MTPEQFAYWLQGYAELNPNQPPTPEQWKMITEHLQTVFHKITSPLSVPTFTPNTTPIWKGPYDVTCGVKDTPTLDTSVYCANIGSNQ